MIECTLCHGFNAAHTEKDVDPRPEMTLPEEMEICLSCHGEGADILAADAPRIPGIAEHVAFVSKKHSVRIDLEKTGGRCIFCHDPHSLD